MGTVSATAISYVVQAAVAAGTAANQADQSRKAKHASEDAAARTLLATKTTTLPTTSSSVKKTADARRRRQGQRGYQSTVLSDPLGSGSGGPLTLSPVLG